MATDRASIKITKRTVDSALPAASRYELWDSELKGFGLRVEPSGSKSFIVRYRAGAGGRTAPKRFMSIGRYGDPWTPDDARRRAKEVLGAAAKGEDPARTKAKERAAATIPELAAAFMAEHVRKKRKPKTAEDYQHVIDNYLLNDFRQRKAHEIARADLSRLHGKLSHKPAIANRLIAVASSMFSWGAEHGYVPEGFNPASRIEKYAEQGRERFLTVEELTRLGEALREAETAGIPWEVDESKATAKHAPKAENRRTVFGPIPVAAVRLLLLTGCRLREVLHLKWEFIDFERGIVFLPDSKTGRKPVVLNAPALAVLASLPRLGPYVLPGDNSEKPRHDLKKIWAAVSRRAGLPGVRIHDLRHTFASVGAGGGMGLPIVGKLLGHSQAATTARYAHLDADPLRRASDRIAGAITAALDGKIGEVVPLSTKVTAR